MHVSMEVEGEARAGCQGLFLYHSLRSLILSELKAHLFNQIAWSSSLQEASLSQCWGYRHTQLYVAFYLGTRGLNSIPSACKASTLTH